MVQDCDAKRQLLEAARKRVDAARIQALTAGTRMLGLGAQNEAEECGEQGNVDGGGVGQRKPKGEVRKGGVKPGNSGRRRGEEEFQVRGLFLFPLLMSMGFP